MKKYTYISIILIVFDLYAFMLGMNPKVSEAYKDYYIKRSITTQVYINIMTQPAP